MLNLLQSPHFFWWQRESTIQIKFQNRLKFKVNNCVTQTRRCVDTLLCFAASFTKWDNFCDFLFASLNHEALPKWAQSWGHKNMIMKLFRIIKQYIRHPMFRIIKQFIRHPIIQWTAKCFYQIVQTLHLPEEYLVIKSIIQA